MVPTGFSLLDDDRAGNLCLLLHVVDDGLDLMRCQVLQEVVLHDSVANLLPRSGICRKTKAEDT